MGTKWIPWAHQYFFRAGLCLLGLLLSHSQLLATTTINFLGVDFVYRVGSGSEPVQVAERTVYETEGHQTVRLIRDGEITNSLTLNLRGVDVTAHQGLDYGLSTTTIEFAPGQTFASFDVTVFDNDAWEGPKVFRVALVVPGVAVDLPFPELLIRLMDDEDLGKPGGLVPGSPDPLTNLVSEVYQLARQSTGAILVAHDARIGGQTISRLTPSGAFDASFAPGLASLSFQSRFWIDPRDRIYVLAQEGSYIVRRYSPNGILDSTFEVTLDQYEVDLSFFPDGRVVFAGQFGRVNGEPAGGFAILTESGTLDPGFQVSPVNRFRGHRVLTRGPHSFIAAMSGFLPLGAGVATFDDLGSLNFSRTATISSDSFDGGFLASRDGSCFYGRSRLLPDGAVVPLLKEVDPEVLYTPGVTPQFVLGEFPDGRLISREGKRLFADGRFDSSFRTDIDGAIDAALVLPDHSVVVGGHFHHVNGIPRNCLAWLATESPATVATVGWNSSHAATPERGEARLTLIRE